MEEKENPEEIEEITDLESYIESIKGVSEQTKNDILRDCRALKEVLAASPRVVYDLISRGKESAKNTIDNNVNQTKNKFFGTIASIRKKVITTVKNAQAKVQGYKQDVKEGMQGVDIHSQEEQTVTAFAAGLHNKVDSRWANEQKEQGRSEIVADSVQNVKETSRNARARIGKTAVKLVGFVGKGLVLFGPKGKDLADRMITATGKKSERFVAKSSRFGKMMERVAEAGYTTADGVRFAKDKTIEGIKFVKDKAEDIGVTVAAGSMYAKDKVVDVGLTVAVAAEKGKNKIKDVAETVAVGTILGTETVKENAKKGALAVGRGTYKTVGTIAGAGLATAEIGKAVGRKTKQFAKNKIVEPAKEKIDGVKDKAIDTKNFGSKFLEFAKAKVSQVRNLPTNLRERTSKILKSAANVVEPSLSDKMSVAERGIKAAQTRDEMTESFNKMTGRENSDGDAR